MNIEEQVQKFDLEYRKGVEGPRIAPYGYFELRKEMEDGDVLVYHEGLKTKLWREKDELVEGALTGVGVWEEQVVRDVWARRTGVSVTEVLGAGRSKEVLTVRVRLYDSVHKNPIGVADLTKWFVWVSSMGEMQRRLELEVLRERWIDGDGYKLAWTNIGDGTNLMLVS